MSRSSKPTWGELIREVRAAGGVRGKQRSTAHEVWVLPSGARVVLVPKHLKVRPRPPIVKRIRAALDQ